MAFMRAYINAGSPSATPPTLTAARKRPGEFGIAVIIAFGAVLSLNAAEPPPNLAKRVAQRETETAEERGHYTYTQSVRLQEMDARGSEAGEYRETREVIFSPTGERSEQFVGAPVSTLKNLIMTDEDFADIRDIQPFVMTNDRLWNYDVDFKGEEPVDIGTGAALNCWVLRIRPKHILSGQRLFDGMLWVKQDDFSVVRSEGQAVPQIVTTKKENLFPRFSTVRKLVNGYWLPSVTSADDTLYFRSGAIREKLVIRYTGYRKFGSDTSVTFDKPYPGDFAVFLS
jgi:hypothetical protein